MINYWVKQFASPAKNDTAWVQDGEFLPRGHETTYWKSTNIYVLIKTVLKYKEWKFLCNVTYLFQLTLFIQRLSVFKTLTIILKLLMSE